MSEEFVKTFRDAYGREFLIVDAPGRSDHGWLYRKTKNGGWVSHRLASDREHEAANLGERLHLAGILTTPVTT